MGHCSNPGPELTNVKKARPCQPGIMIRVTHAIIDVSTEVKNRAEIYDWNTVDDDRAKGATMPGGASSPAAPAR